MRFAATCFAVIGALIAGCAKEESVHVEPQIGLKDVIDVAYDPQDATRVVFVEVAGAITLWKIDAHSRDRLRTIMTDAVRARFIGDNIVSVHRDGSLCLWKRDGTRVEHKRGANEPTALEVAGAWILSGDTKGALHLWSHDLGIHREFSFYKGPLLDIDVQRGDASVIATVGDNRARVSRISDGKPALIREYPLDDPQAVSLSRTGTLVVGGSKSLEICQPDGSCKLLYSVSTDHLAFSPTLDLFVMTNNIIGGVFLTDGTLISPRGKEAFFGPFAFSPAGDRLVALSGHEGGPSLWTFGATPTYPAVNLNAIGVAYLDEQAIAATQDQIVFLEREQSAMTVARTVGLPKYVRLLKVSKKRDIIAVVTSASDMRGEAVDRAIVMNADGGGPRELPPDDIRDLAISSRDGIVATLEDHGRVRFWNRSGAEARPQILVGDKALRIVFAPNEDAVIALNSKSVDWLAFDGHRLRRAALPEGEDVSQLAVSPDGSQIAVAGKSALLLDRDAAVFRKLEQPSSAFGYALAFSPHESVLATASKSGIRLWNRDGTPRGEAIDAPQHEQSVSELPVSIAFSGKGEELMVARGNGAVGWLLMEMTWLQQIENASPLWNADVSGDNMRVATLDPSNGLQLWSSEGKGGNILERVEKFNRSSDSSWQHDVELDEETESFLVRDHRDVSLFDANTRRIKSIASDAWRISHGRGGEIIWSTPTMVSWGKPGQPPVQLKVDARKAVTYLRATDEIAHAGGEFVFVSNRQGLRWSTKVSGGVNVLAAGDQACFAAANSNGVIVWQKKSDREWSRSAQFKVAEHDLPNAIAFAPGHCSKLLVGTEEGTLAIHDTATGRILGTPVALGYCISRAGWNRNRVWALLSSGQVLFTDHDLNPTAMLTVKDDKGVITTPQGWYSGDDTIVRVYRGMSDQALEKPDAMLTYMPKQVVALVTGRGESWQRIRGWIAEEIEQLRKWIAAHDWWEIGGALVGLLYGLVLFTVVCIWLVRPDLPTRWTMVPHATPNVPPLKRLAEILSITSYLGHTRRSVEAWLSRSRKDLERKFDKEAHVVARSQYVDLGNQADITRWSESVESATPAAVWITGPGGCGKSTLAIRLANVARKAGRRKSIPVFVDTDWTGDVVDAVAARMTVDRKRLTRAMVERLADRGLVVLIVDGLSERRVANAEQQVASAAVFRFRIATSREPAPDGSPFRIVCVGPLTRDGLRSFVAEYVAEADVDVALKDVSALATKDGIRPLFARLALERRAAAGDFPKTYPTLVQDHVVSLAPGGESALRSEDFLRAARITALACVEEDCSPRPISTEILRGSLRVNAQRLPFARAAKPSESLSDLEVIDQMIACGLVEKVMSLGVAHIRFAFDPIAEYLAAMEIAAGGETYKAVRERVEKSQSALREALQRVDETRRAA